MADVPNVNPSKPIWPTRPDERAPGRRPPGGERRRERDGPDAPADAEDGGGDHLIDEYA